MDFKIDIQKSLKVLYSGGTIIFPTDTVWGIGCDATNDAAVKEIYKIKNRDTTKPLICLVSSFEIAEQYVGVIPEFLRSNVSRSHKPTTLVYSHCGGISHYATALDESIAIRVTNEKFSHELCAQFGKPIVATSANFAGLPTPQNFAQIDPDLFTHVGYVVQYRQDDMNLAEPSAVIKISDIGEVEILRK